MKEGHVQRHLDVAIVVLCIFVVLSGVPPSADAGGQERRGTFAAEATPFPNSDPEARKDDPGCMRGVEGVHKVSHPVDAPFTGLLTAELDPFTGDWDLGITDRAGNTLTYAGNVQDMTTAESGTETITTLVRKGQRVNVTPCNFHGEPSVSGSFVLRPFDLGLVAAKVAAEDSETPPRRVFEPTKVRIRAGDAVLWHNPGDLGHTITDKKDGWDSGFIGTGRFARVYTKPGRYPYVCVIHPGMKGVVVVRRVR